MIFDDVLYYHTRKSDTWKETQSDGEMLNSPKFSVMPWHGILLQFQELKGPLIRLKTEIMAAIFWGMEAWLKHKQCHSNKT